jgi:membrane-associated phospholipid phosphatase
MSDAKNVQRARVGDVVLEGNHRKKHYRSVGLVVTCMLWLLAVALMIALSLFAHTHPQPLPFELTTSRDLQSLPFPWVVQATMRWFTAINDPGPDVFIVPIAVLILALIRQFRAAIFLALSAGIGNGIDALIGDYVGRPRPNPQLIHVDSLLKFNSFPSGHSCHMMVFYGFLLYLSLTKPVRQWKYHLALLPLQIFAMINILIMGFARLWEGEHWVTDVVGGYLDGAIWLIFFIFLYNWTTDRLRERRARRAMQQAL